MSADEDMLGLQWEQWFSFVLFLISTSMCLHEMCCRARELHEQKGVQGWSFRKWFHSLLLISNATRMIASLLEVAFVDVRYQPDNFSSWLAHLLRGIPSLFFFSTYSMVILFWAQLLYIAASVRLRMLRPAFFTFNAFVYITFAALAATTGVTEEYETFWQMDLYFNGAVYGVGAVFSVLYAFRILPQLSRGRKSLNASDYATARILDRVMGLLVMCAFVFVLRSGWSFAVAFMWKSNERFQEYYSDLVMFFFVEFFPTCIILYMSRPQHPPVLLASHSQSPYGMASVANVSGDYTNLASGNGIPISRAHPTTFTTRGSNSERSSHNGPGEDHSFPDFQVMIHSLTDFSSFDN